MTYHAHAVAARATLEAAGISAHTARLDADLLARHVLGWDQARWIAHRDDLADAAFADHYQTLIARRASREPVAQIRGVQEFWGREFFVSSAVLTPRPETEILIDAAAAYLAAHPNATVVDVGTGSGCIAITLALEHPPLTVTGTDISDAALNVARQNAERLGVARRVQFRQGSFLADIARPIDLIVSNPPYVAEIVAPALAPEVRDFEPPVALYGGQDGLQIIRGLLREARHALVPGGQLIFEIGYDQADAVTEAVRTVEGLAVVGIRDDLQGIPRTVIVRRTSN